MLSNWALPSNRPFPIPSDLGIERPNPVYRAACACLHAHLSGESPIDAARALFGKNYRTELVLRGTTEAAAIGTAAWAKELGHVAIYDVIADATSISAGAELITRGLQLNMDGIAEYRVPGRALTAAAAGKWIGENEAVPVRQLLFSDSVLSPHKLESIYGFTHEQAQHSNIEAIVRQTLSEATGLALDLQMLSDDPGSAGTPPGIFATSDVIAPTTNGGRAAMDGDLEKLFKALAAKGGGKTAVIVAPLAQAKFLESYVSPKFSTEILVAAMTPNTVGVVEVASFVSGFRSKAEFNTSHTTLLHFEDTAPTDITGGTPSPAVPVRSMFQVDGIALATRMWGSWALRAPGHAQWIKACTW
jgi:hypothetical protein